ncbi:hypothetical protein CUMW_206970 [Citrus unshiu]|uniref:Bacterial Ig-like domain-containing protein n=1 Tax=Citrus unshiu TaxID=55188 RepID=A0A2H5Q8V9_CITUN|nr:hypothetical protein CUMW_206970 [Citrus unshiu]
MGWFKFLKLSGCLAMMVMVGALNSADSTVLIHFDRAPPARSRFSTAVFQFSVKRPDGSDACQNNECSVHYQLDDQILRPCPTDVVVLKNLTLNGQHDFLLNVTTSSGERNSSSYSWFIDIAGNAFTRTNGSIIVIRFDRRPVLVDLWVSIPAYELEFNGVSRTVLASNKLEDVKIFLDFSIPIMNSTEQILDIFRLNSGNLIAVHGRRRVNRRFVFKLKDIPQTEIITLALQASFLLGITGTPVSPVPSLIFLYDSTKPGVGLSTSSPSITKDPNIKVIVEFSKPVFGFESSMVDVDGGSLKRQELSRALYSLTVQALTQHVVRISIPENKVRDISGNLNLASNILEVKHYSTPAISTALHSFVTAGMLATSLAAAILSISSANLGVLGTLNSGSTDFVASNPSMNLQGMVGHLQVFVLSDWFLANQPIEYSETTKGLRWLIPRQKLPWRNDSASVWPNHVYLAKESLTEQFRYLPIGSSHEGSYHQIGLNLTSSSCIRCELPFPTVTNQKFSWPDGRYNVSIKNAPYGQFLNSSEYFTYFLRGEPISASNVVKKLDNYTGWRDLEMNLFWLGVGGGSLLIVHFLTLLFLRWRMGTSVKGMLSVPRFELLFVILMLPCISQSSAFVIRGGTTEGIITGALLLAIPAALILSVLLFVIIAIFLGSFVQYKEITHVTTSEKWHVKLWFFFMGRPATGKWFYREGLPSIFFPIFGILFENRKGPPLLVFAEDNDPNTITKWTESGRSGIGRMRAVSSDDSNEEVRIRTSVKLLGCARSSYIILDLLRRVSIGIISGAYPSNKLSQSLLALAITLIQFISLFTLKPYIQRGVHTVESVSLLCEVGIFALCIRLNGSNPTEAKTLGFLMLALLFLMFVAQIINEWYAMIKGILGLSQPQKNSFRLGLKFVAKGLVLPLLPRRHWSRVMPGSSRPLTGLAPVLPQSPETECGRRGPGGSNADPFSAMTATVVPVSSPGSPGLNVAQAAHSTPTDLTLAQQRAREGKQAKGLKLEPKSDLKKLRELARASFSGDSKGEGTSTSYAFRQQSVSAETSVENSQASTSKFKQ